MTCELLCSVGPGIATCAHAPSCRDKCTRDPAHLPALVPRTVQIWNERRPTQHAAALAYYSMFAFAPVLYVIVRVAGRFFSEPVVTDTLNTFLVTLLGADVADYVAEMVANTAADSAGGSLLTTIISTGALLYAATGFFVHLQRTLNSIWEAHRQTEGTVRRFWSGALSPSPWSWDWPHSWLSLSLPAPPSPCCRT
ncbi:MAG: YihY/virulence factor BrkB family protein [Caldilineaceae bacterium]